jgi:hypothetical protein
MEGAPGRLKSPAKKMPAIALFCLFFLGSAEVLNAQSLERVRIAYSSGGLISFPLIITKEKKIFQTEGSLTPKRIATR